MSNAGFGGMGWERDLPDFRDYTQETPEVADVLERSKPFKAATKQTPATVDLRPQCSAIEDQGSIGSCTANAGVALLEYFERRAFGRYVDHSRLFLYKGTRNLLGWTGDQGAYLRSTMQAMVMLGVPPEDNWPYDVARFDDEPPPFCYALGQAYKTLRYYRLDPPGTGLKALVPAITRSLAAGLPCMFGFTVYTSFPRVGDGQVEIPIPQPGERRAGGHAVVAVGYDDGRVVSKTRGALLIRNSWGTGWGDKGYGWMPYAYVERGLAVDFWSLSSAEFVDTELFQ